MDISQKTFSELHVVHIRDTAGTFDGFFIGSLLDKEDLQRLVVEAQKLLDPQVKQIDAAGGVVA